jgi:hypothetical protein
VAAEAGRPVSRARTAATRSGSLCSGASPGATVSSPVQPKAAAVPTTTVRSRSSSSSRSLGCMVRAVPCAWATSPITFGAVPACSMPTVTTAGRIGSTTFTASRAASTLWHSAGTGSRVRCG